MENENSSELQLLKVEINNLNNKIDILTNSLNTHINFIENVFNYVKRPMFYVVDKINNIFLLNNK